jgi:hypothetical protein
MFVKKSVQLSIALVLLLALASLGLAYGAWTDSLQINGTVQTGTLDVQLQVPGFDDTDCSYTLTGDDDTLTITGVNVVPGMVCWSQIEVVNNGSIPILIDDVVVTESGEGYWEMDCNFEGMTLPPNSFGGECLVWADIPADNSSQGKTAGIAITVHAIQAP